MFYKGTVKPLPPFAKGRYGFIDVASVTTEDGSAGHALDTKEDVFLHSDALGGVQLRAGMEVCFEAARDTRRPNAYVATAVSETIDSGLANLGEGGIQLRVQGVGNSSLLASAGVFATWCVLPPLAPKLRELKLQGMTVRLLLIQWRAPVRENVHTRHTSEEEVRQLVSLSDPMAPLAFTAPGRHHVVALLVWGANDSRLEETFLARRMGYYDTDVISRRSNGVRLSPDDDFDDGWFGTGCIDIEMPEELFAKRPFDWRWVNLFWGNKGPRDQCGYRGRRLFAYTIQPVALALFAVLFGTAFLLSELSTLLCVLAALSFGIREIDFRTLLYPMEGAPWRVVSSDRVTSRLVIWHGKRRNMFPLVFSPVVMLVAALVSSTIVSIPAHALAWSWVSFAVTYGVTIAAWAFVSILAFKFGDDVAESPLASTIDAELTQFVCDGTGPHVADVWRLPLRPRNFRFYFLDLKVRVCQNFARK